FAHTAIVSGLGALAVFGPRALEWLAALLGSWLKPSLVLGWVATTGFGLLAGRRPSTGGTPRSSSLDPVGRIAPYRVVIGMLLLLSYATQAVLPPAICALHHEMHEGAALPQLDERFHASGPVFEYWAAMDDSLDSCLWLFMLGLAFVALLISWRVGVNEFSMHALYRNRLARCYFGASNQRRNPHPFTGFDPDDDNLRVHELADPPGSAEEGKGARARGPYPILNAALNL